MADFKRVGYGQVEPNQLSAQKTGQIYASLPLDTDVKVLQNGEFMFYDYQSGTVSADDSTGVAEPMLVFNEIKLYEPFWRRSYKDFAMIRVGDNYVTSTLAVNGPIEGKYGDGAETVGVPANPAHTEYPYRMDGIAPRLFKTNVGDIYTTNMVKVGTGIEYAVGDKLKPVKDTTSNTLVLEKDNTATTGMIWVVVKVYTMPDGQDGLKLQRVH
jgi:hypothetical protein